MILFRSFYALVFHGGQAACEDRFADERQRNALVQRRNARPFARALLTGGVENLFHDGLAVGVLIGQNVAGDLN